MTWSYGGDPSTSTKDRVRYLLGDTKETAQSLTDEEIAYELTIAEDDAVKAAIAVAESMASRYAGLSGSSKKVGDVMIANDHAGTAQRFRDLARRLAARYGGIAVPLIMDTRESVFAIGAEDNMTYYADDTARRYL